MALRLNHTNIAQYGLLLPVTVAVHDELVDKYSASAIIIVLVAHWAMDEDCHSGGDTCSDADDGPGPAFLAYQTG